MPARVSDSDVSGCGRRSRSLTTRIRSAIRIVADRRIQQITRPKSSSGITSWASRPVTSRLIAFCSS
jgi:hypothetical protein